MDGDVRIDQDSSGDIRISDVRNGVAVLADSSGQVKLTRVKGDVQLP